MFQGISTNKEHVNVTVLNCNLMAIFSLKISGIFLSLVADWVLVLGTKFPGARGHTSGEMKGW